MTIGQQRLFDAPSMRVTRRSWSVTANGRTQPATTNLPIAVARARAASLQGYRAVILATDGTSAEVWHEDERFLVIPHDPADWPDVVRRLLDERG